MRHLGIDYGTRRVGLALSDAGGTFVSPLAVLEVTTDAVAQAEIVAVVEREGAEVLVVGLPINMDGTEGPSAKNVRTWARSVADAVKLPLCLVDERQSSLAAEAVLASRRRGGENLTRKRKKKRLDAVAAAGFLQAYLNGELSALSGSDIPTGVARD